MKFPYNIQFGFRPRGGSGGGTTSHNALIGIQGGAINDNFHLTGSDFNKVQNFINPYQVPSVSLIPGVVGSNLEVGDSLNINALINTTFANPANIYQNRVTIDGTDFLLPKPNYQLNLVTNHNVRGNKTLSTVSIRRSDNQALINAFVSAFWEYKVFYFLHNNSDNLIINYTDASLVALIKTKQGVLRADKVLGIVQFTPVGLQNIYVAYPLAYGQVEMATPTFQNNLVVRTDRNFIYTNNGVNTNYRLTRMEDFISGAYDSLIK